MFDRTGHHTGMLYFLKRVEMRFWKPCYRRLICASAFRVELFRFRKALRGQSSFLLELYVIEQSKLSYFLFLMMEFISSYIPFWLESLADAWLNQCIMWCHTRCFVFFMLQWVYNIYLTFQEWVLMWLVGYFLSDFIPFGALKRYLAFGRHC